MRQAKLLMRQTGILGALAACAIFWVGEARAQQLAVGAASYGQCPVYVFARGPAVDPSPRGYRFVYVRGYRMPPTCAPKAVAVKKAHVVKKKVVRHAMPKRVKIVKRARGCVTDLGFGRHEYCG